MKKRIWSYALLALIFTATGLANVTALARIDDLLNSQLRPTVAEFHRIHQPWPAQNPYQLSNFAWNGNPVQLGILKKRLAQFIAQLEKFYPGARYVALGRDVHNFGDAMDAFYTSIGQPGRIVRLNASTASFSGVSSANLVRFLQQAGLDLSEFQKNPETKGFIIFDGTHYSEGSQSRRLLSAIYKEAHERGMNLATLLRKINVVSVAYPEYYSQNLLTETEPEEFFLRVKKTVGAAGPTEIVSFDGYSMTHGLEWHGAFGAIDESGMTRPGKGGDPNDRKLILGDIYEFIRYFGGDEFHGIARAEFAKQGIEFPTKNLKVVAPDSPPARSEEADVNHLENLREQIAIFRAYPVLDDAKYIERKDLKLTRVGWQLFDWLQLAQKTQGLISDFVILVVEMKAKGSVGDRDARRLLRLALETDLRPQDAAELADFFKRSRADADYLATKVLVSEDGVPSKSLKNGDRILPDWRARCHNVVRP